MGTWLWHLDIIMNRNSQNWKTTTIPCSILFDGKHVYLSLSPSLFSQKIWLFLNHLHTMKDCTQSCPQTVNLNPTVESSYIATLWIEFKLSNSETAKRQIITLYENLLLITYFEWHHASLHCAAASWPLSAVKPNWLKPMVRFYKKTGFSL